MSLTTCFIDRRRLRKGPSGREQPPGMQAKVRSYLDLLHFLLGSCVSWRRRRRREPVLENFCVAGVCPVIRYRRHYDAGRKRRSVFTKFREHRFLQINCL